jgi:hypothetical protein
MPDLDPVAMDRAQVRHLADAKELWSHYASVVQLGEEMRGAMGWKTVKGREYLTWYWTDPLTGRKHMNSMGARSPETETKKADFDRGRAEVDRVSAELKVQLEPLIRVGKALRLGRLDPTAAAVLRKLDRKELLGPDLMVIGSATMHLYECSAGVFLPNSIIPSGDLDLMTTASDRLETLEDLLPVIRRSDKSFRLHEASRTAQNDDGFRIHLHKRRSIEHAVGGFDGISDGQVEALHSLLHLDPVRTVAIARDGTPVEMVGTDPRCFALLKHARSAFDPNREGSAGKLDQNQAFAVGTLVQRHWPKPFEPEHLDAFPGFAESIETGDPEASETVRKLFGP